MIDTDLRALPHGITLSCRSAGPRGRPVLMFLHGFPEGAFAWDALLEHFSDPAHGGWRCVAPDLRGYGRSSAPEGVAAYRPQHLMADVEALIDDEGGRVGCLVAHDWGGALAWGIAARSPQRLARLAIVNAPHPATFARDLAHDPAQQAASAYMRFLVRPDAERLLAEDDFRRLWGVYTGMGAVEGGRHGWLDEAAKARYREAWRAGLAGPLNWYRATRLLPPGPDDPGAAAVRVAPEAVRVEVPTLVVWGMDDTALLPGLLAGLDEHVPRLTVRRVEDATHWIVHERPGDVIEAIEAFLAAATPPSPSPTEPTSA